MLSQYDRQQLELIATRLRTDDPDLARALRDGRPRPNPTNLRWPFVMIATLAALVFMAGILVGSFGFLFVGTAAVVLTILAYRRYGRRAPRVRKSRRYR